MNTTIDYFNEKAQKAFEDAFTITERSNQDHFLSFVKEGGHILDFGCGSGRDTKYFLDRGFKVTASDGSAEMVKLASAYLKMPVRLQEFNELDDIDLYDGIFASASIMHLEFEKLIEVFPKMIRALKNGGILYASFKYGIEDGYLGKRYYTNMTEKRLENLIGAYDELETAEMGTFGNEHPNQPSFKWIYVILRKKEEEPDNVCAE